MDKTWPNLKTYFKNVQTELEEIRGPTMQQAGYHHANMLADQLRESIKNQGHEILTMLRGFSDNPPNDEDQPPPLQPNLVTNAAAQQDIQLEMPRVLQASHLNYAKGRGGRGGRGGRCQGNCNRIRRNTGNENCARRIMDHYCSTHSGCNYASRDCTTKASTHNNEAIMDNRLGGSIRILVL